jgi:hypothetical protein
VDKTRYREDIANWKKKKEAEDLAVTSSSSTTNSTSTSLEASGSSFHCISNHRWFTESRTQAAVGNNNTNNTNEWNTPQHRSLERSSSIDSEKDFTLDPLSTPDTPVSFIGCTHIGNIPMTSDSNLAMISATGGKGATATTETSSGRTNSSKKRSTRSRKIVP